MIQSVIARNYNKDSAAYSNMTTPLFTQIQELKERMKRHEDVLSEQELEHSIHLCKLICEAKQLPAGRIADFKIKRPGGDLCIPVNSKP